MILSKRAILFFVKYPTPGKVKTRLAKTVGTDEAAHIYRQLAQTNYAVLRSVIDTDLIVMFDPPEDALKIKQWFPDASYCLAQHGDDLGERLNQAFKIAFQNGYSKVIALGSDILGLTTDIVEQGFLLLDSTDVVIGPAKDGGYYLIGSAHHYPELFQGISWSTQKVFNETSHALEINNLRYKTLLPLDDLDEIKTGDGL